MKTKTLFTRRLVVGLSAFFAFMDAPAQLFTYPPTLRHPVSDTIWGKIVIDDYRWLEDMSSEAVNDWIKAQADFTDSILDKIPGRDLLIAEYGALDKLTPVQFGFYIRNGGNRYFYEKRSPGENVGRLYYRQGKYGVDTLLFDPNADATDKKASVTFDFFPSGDGRHVALVLSEGGVEVSTIRIMNVDNKKFYPETIHPAFSITTWSPDHNGFIYVAPQTSEHLSKELYKDTRAMYHVLDTDPEKDKVIFSRLHDPQLNIKPEELVSVSYSQDEKYLIASAKQKNWSFFAPASDLLKKNIRWKRFIMPEDEQISSGFLRNDKAFLFSKDTSDEAYYKLSMCPINNIDPGQAKTILSWEGKTVSYSSQTLDYFFVSSTDGVNHFVDQYHFETGEISSVTFPFGGAVYVNGYDGRTNDCFLNVLSRNQPRTRYEYDPVSRQSILSPFNSHAAYTGISDLVVEELEVPGHDGVMIPLSLVYNKNIKKDGTNIVYMTGYGAYGSISVPWFQSQFLPLFNRGVILAETHPRGGGDKGYVWHKGGFKATKPNTWKDFISCAEYLISNQYTSPKLVIAEGYSAGGILVGRAITERPDLFGASIHNVPLSNPLRGENRANGDMDAKEFGTVKDSVEAMGLMQMDSYLHVEQGVDYPAVLAIGGINDSRVPVWQPAKFAAALQRASASGKPVLLKVNYDSGHMSAEKFVQFRMLADKFAFALWQTGHKDFQPEK